jgi:hypothetical protein
MGIAESKLTAIEMGTGQAKTDHTCTGVIKVKLKGIKLTRPYDRACDEGVMEMIGDSMVAGLSILEGLEPVMVVISVGGREVWEKLYPSLEAQMDEARASGKQILAERQRRPRLHRSR